MTVKIKIDKGVPVPPKSRTGLLLALKSLGVGDSMFQERRNYFPTADMQDETGFHFTQRRVTEKGKTGFRIWRTK